MKRLNRVYSGLRRLRMLRLSVRWGAAASMVLSIVLWLLAGACLLDLLFRMDRLERAIVLVVVLGGTAWAVVWYLLPALRARESNTALAVMVDARQGMHSDLVAAIQFDDELRSQYGSRDLREAVIEYVDDAAGSLNFMEGFSRRQLGQRLIIFLITAAACLVLAVVFPGYSQAFFNRLLLGTAQYPTRTIIEAVESPGDKAPYGRPIRFVVRGGGELPDAGVVKVETVETGLDTSVELTRDPDDPKRYVGTLNRVLDDLSYVVYLGDARAGPRRVKMIPLPLVELEMKVTTPAYAAGKLPARPHTRRQVVVLEGSRVVPVVTADKPLDSATLVIEKGGRRLTMRRRGDAFVLDDPSCPLARVTQSVHFQMEVTDRDGLRPERPVRGVVQVTADLPPRVALAAFSQLVVAKASPELRYRAIDDYALGELKLHRTVIRADGEEEHSAEVIARPQRRRDYRGSYKLNLAPLDLQKGDQVAIAVEAIDYRGPAEGKGKLSEKWVFDVTDRAGVLRAMAEVDEQMDKKLDEVLRVQLEVGS